MPGPAASATNVGAGSPRTTSSPRAGGGGAGGARQRKGASSGAVRTTRAGGTSSGGMWRFYTDDSPGIKVRIHITFSQWCLVIYNGIFKVVTCFQSKSLIHKIELYLLSTSRMCKFAPHKQMLLVGYLLYRINWIVISSYECEKDFKSPELRLRQV